SSFTISPASASQLTFMQQPTDSRAGVALSPAVTVAVADAFGNPLTTSTIAAAVATGPGSLGGTLTASVANGVATFTNLVFQKAGTYTLTLTDDSLRNATTAGVTITAAAPSQLAFTQQPTTTTPYSALSPVVVAVEDAFGNVVT